MTAPLEDYFRLMVANGAVQLYRAAWKHGIIDTLAKEPMTLHKLARTTALNEPALVLLIDGLSSLGVIENTDGALRLGPVMQALRGGYRALGDEYWSHLDKWLVTGLPMRRMDTAAEGESAYRDQAAALAWMMAPAAGEVAAMLAPTLPPDAAILDIGAGSGVWSRAFLSALPASTATLVDREGVLAVAKEFLTAAGMDSRAQLSPGDYHTISLPPGSHDLAILANVCHLETAKQNRSLIERTARWLNPGGKIAVIDISPAQAPLAASLYTIGLALRTESGTVPSADQITDWLASAGFLEPEFHPLRATPGTMGLWTAERARI